MSKTNSVPARRDAIAVSPATATELGKNYPFAVRQAIKLCSQLVYGTLDIEMPDGKTFRFGGVEDGPYACMIVHDVAFAEKVARGGEVGVADAYLSGMWSAEDLEKFLELFCYNQQVIEKLLADKPIIRFVQMIRHWMNRNTKWGSKRNIHAHYDLGNKFYSQWLDRTMTYSSALYAEGDNDLASAQTRKYRELARQMNIQREHHVLEIGCGWGGFAEFVAREIGCKVTGLTISQEQFDFATKRMADAGLSDKVEIKYLDYRDEKGVYDRIASIEMFEAVGEEYWSTYFGQLHDRLKPNGIAGLQVITIQETLFPKYRRELDFIRRYIFPGGMLPTATIMRELGDRYGLKLAADRMFGIDYARTLAQWRDTFLDKWPALTTLGFDERFRRMWEFYLSYCEAGFRAGTIDVRQMVYRKS
ncbi:MULTISPECIES: cyclopropane-fatty-acyl-phospholipid synthase family protein [unclassified Beijerinckia]|uniref:SAM-dependent methyltransferase n=1 Tax=unclassified Beijerinckia TaxID=2638183 RepID=UPI0008942444|nr:MULTISPECIES: cyclopropane-fatty-acyl-phospholipid synthase family protein [unclassified Beijerinckia]MDH7795751.1 cyclopropane-fatty-acyl-phospholipid synthase [Beijerinckia sp. GAS462]SEC14642.1 cyclopropane-fatty-acyl-phospholipid synthase [Beijerinckia sp. 28-YEA-48]